MSERKLDTHCKIFVGNIPFSYGDNDLKELFDKEEGVESAVIIKDFNTGFSRGFGFIIMKTEEHKEQLLNKGEIWAKNRKLNLSDYIPTTKKNIFIPLKNYLVVEDLPSNITRDDLKNIFSKYGKVKKHFIFTNYKTGNKLNRGFIEIEDDNDFKNLLQKRSIMINGNSIYVNRWKVSIKKDIKDNFGYINLYKKLYNKVNDF
jgi:RNA recognition motif-containing protein